MTFPPSAEQRTLVTSVARFFSDYVTPTYLRHRLESPTRLDPQFASGLRALGLHEYFAAGREAGAILGDLSLIAQEIGRALAPDNTVLGILTGPYLEGGGCGPEGSLSRAFGDSRGRALAEGSLRATLYPVHPERLSVVRNGACRAVISGALEAVPGFSPNGVVLLLDESQDLVWGVSSDSALGRDETSLDPTEPLSSLVLDSAEAVLLEGISGRRLGDAERILRSSELAGVCARAVSMTVDYVKTRKQFGVEIGSFQAVQHSLADAYLHTQALEALSRFAAWSYDASPAQSHKASLAAMLFACDHAGEVVETAIQLHGGIGFTWEYDLHLFLRRARFVEALMEPGDHEAVSLLEAVVSS